MKQDESNPTQSAGSANANSISLDSSPAVPLLLIFGAWVAGTLLFEISALDEARVPATPEHWGARATVMEKWTASETLSSLALSEFDRQPLEPRLSDQTDSAFQSAQQ